MHADFEHKEYISCKITDSLISEYDVSIDGVSTANTYTGVYWEAAVYFDNNDFALNVFAERADGVEEVEVLKFPLKKIRQISIFEAIYAGTIKKEFKIASIAGAVSGLMVLLSMLIHPAPGYSDIGSILPIVLFVGIGLTLVFFAFLAFFFSPEKNICINLITDDKRLITVFTDIEQKERNMEIIYKYFEEIKNKGFPYMEINLN